MNAGDTVQILEFTPRGTDVIPPSLTGLSVTLSVPLEQPQGQGLNFAVSVANTTSEPISVHNPYDVFKYQLSNGDGWPIALRSPPSRIKTHRYVHRAPYIEVRSIQLNDAELPNVAAELERAELILEGGATYRYHFAIDATAAPQDQDGPTQIVPDVYSLKTSVSLIPVVSPSPPGATVITEPVQVAIVEDAASD